MIAIYTFTSTIIAGVFSMAFSKKIEQPDIPTEPIKSFYEIEIKDIEYPLKPLVFQLHKYYKDSGDKITIKGTSP